MAPVDPATKAPHIIIDMPEEDAPGADIPKKTAPKQAAGAQDNGLLLGCALSAGFPHGASGTDPRPMSPGELPDAVQNVVSDPSLPPVSETQLGRIHRLAQDHAAYKTLQSSIELAGDAKVDPANVAVTTAIEQLVRDIPSLSRRHPHRRPDPPQTGTLPPPPNTEVLQSNVIGLVISAMINAFRSGNEDKRTTLMKTEMYNQMLARLNRYVSEVLMDAQVRISHATRTLNKSKVKARTQEQAAVVIDGLIDDFNTEYAPRDKETEAYVPQLSYDAAHGGSRQLTQADLQVYIDQANQWRQSIMNNQQKQASMFQGVDSNQTSFLNGLSGIVKSAHDTAMALSRNLQA